MASQKVEFGQVNFYKADGTETGNRSIVMYKQWATSLFDLT